MTGPATTLIRSGRPQGARPHERFLLSPEVWARLPGALQAEPMLTLLGLWAEPGIVHAAFLDERPGGVGGGVMLASTSAPEGRYIALSPSRPGAALFERAVRDLWGLAAEGAADSRPWLDHGRWLFDAPLSVTPVRRSATPPQPEFFPRSMPPAGAHQLPLGPVRGLVAGPAHLRLLVEGDAVLRLGARLGYAHKGSIALMLGKSPRLAARFAARLSGDSTVAHADAFATAVEAAAGAEPPPRALLLRAVMGELERVANHLNGWGRLCAEAGASWLRDCCGRLRESLLRACGAAFGHRLMMDLVLPGGVAADGAPGGLDAVAAAVAVIGAALPALVSAGEAVLERASGLATVPPALAARFAAGGFVGRASGRGLDSRRAFVRPPYDVLPPAVPVLTEGDAAARLRVRMAELAESVRLLPLLLARLEATPGALSVPLPSRAGEGVGFAESFRGEVLHWVALDDAGLLRACFPRDASWLHWPLLELASAGGELSELGLCEASFDPSCSGVDL